MNVGTITALLRLRDVNFKAGLVKARTGMAALGKQLGVIGKKMTATGKKMFTRFTMPILAIAGASLKMAADFETGMTKITTLVGISTEAVSGMKDTVIDLSRETGIAATELAEGLFFITSAGLRGEKALQALEAAAKASALGLGEVATIADATTSAMNAYGQENLTAARATNIIALAIRAGKLEASQLAPVLGRLLPTASAMGVEFEQVAGILAVMSRTGLDAAEASTSLSSIMTTLLKPTNQARKALQKVGLAHSDLRATAAGPKGLIQVMRDLNDAFADDDEALVQVVPNIRAFRGVMNVLAQDVEVVSEVMATVAEDIDVLSEGMEELEKTVGFKTKRAFNELKLEFMAMGDAMVPMWEAIVAEVSEFSRWIREMHPETKKMAGQVLKILAVGGPLLMAFGYLSTAISGIIGLFTLLGGPGAILLVVAGAFGYLAADVALANAQFEAHADALERAEESQKAYRDAAIPVLQVLVDFKNNTEAQELALQRLAREYVFAGKSVRDLMKGTQSFISTQVLGRETGLRMIDVLRKAETAAKAELIVVQEASAAREIASRLAREYAAVLQDLITTFDAGVPFVFNMKEALEKLNAEFKEAKAVVSELSVEFDVGLPVSGPPVTNAITNITGAMKSLNITMPDVSREMEVLRRLSSGLSPELEKVGVTSEIVATQAQGLYDKYFQLGVLTPELEAELVRLGATTKDLGDETRTSTAAWGEFFDIIKTGITWVDTLVEGVFKLIDSLMKEEGLKGALNGIGDIISGVFGGKDSKTGQLIGGMVSKLSMLDFGSLFGKATGGAATGGGGIGGWLTNALGGLFGAGGAAAAGGGAAAAGGTVLGLAPGAAVAGTGLFMPTLAGGGAAAAGTGLSMASIGTFMTGPYGIAIMAGLALWKSGALGKMADFAKDLFGVSKAEKEARQIKASLDDLFASVIDGQQKAEAGGIRWKINNIIVRDSFLAIGKSQAEADAAMKRLADTSKQTPEQAQATVDSIVAIVEQVKAQMEETGLSMTELRNRNINAAIVAAEAAKKAMEETATAAAEAAAATAAATVAAVKETATAATGEIKTSIAGTLISVVSACGGMKKVAKESAQEINESFTRSLESVKDVAASTATKVKEAFDIDLTGPIDSFGKRMADMATGGAATALATAGAGAGGGGGVGFEDQNSLRLAALMEALPTIMERAVKHGLQTTGRKVRN